jgi:hypothetical protein
MAKLEHLLGALSEGRSARREEWESIIRMFVLGETLMCQCGTGRPWRLALNWDEITATDWQLVQDTTSIEQPPARPSHHLRQSSTHMLLGIS